MQPLVLAVDDEPGILRLIQAELELQGLRVATASNGREAIEMAAKERPDVAVLDITMPQMDGLETMRQLRESASIPCILLTGHTKSTEKVSGLQDGADDYVVKPFSPDELGARIRAILRRSSQVKEEENILTSSNVTIDLTRRLVRKNGQLINLTRTEWLLLEHMANNAGKVILNRDMLSAIWGMEYRDELQFLRVWISRLRAKLEDTPSSPVIIKTFANIGYKLEIDND